MRVTEIIPGLWQSDWPDLSWMPAHGIRAVLNVVPDEQRRCPAYPDGVVVHRLPFLDVPGSAPPRAWMDAAADIVADEGAKGGLLVHCLVGNNRSTIAVCAGLVRMRKCTPAAALATVSAVRAVAPAPEWVAAFCEWAEEATACAC